MWRRRQKNHVHTADRSEKRHHCCHCRCHPVKDCCWCMGQAELEAAPAVQLASHLFVALGLDGLGRSGEVDRPGRDSESQADLAERGAA